MKLSTEEVQLKKFNLPSIRFRNNNLTSFAGIVLFQTLFRKLNLYGRLAACFDHLQSSSIYRIDRIFLLLILHVTLGFRRLREVAYYKEDPMVLRAATLKRIPNVSTITRSIRQFDQKAFTSAQTLSQEIVIDRLQHSRFRRLTIDFDGSVLWTKSRNTEGTAIGYNSQKRGARGYYPLFATVAQTGQVLNLLHRPGNIHDTQGAMDFIRQTFTNLASVLPDTKFEARFDAAHFNQSTCFWLDANKIEFSITVAFRTLSELKTFVENQSVWHRIDDSWSYFEMEWKPKCWPGKMRFIFYRQRCPIPKQGPIQLDLFYPIDHRFDYKVVVTNKTTSARNVLHFHNGRGSQEGIFAELKSQAQLGYLPTRRLLANQMFTMAAVFAHNLYRELHMTANNSCRATSPTRPPRWIFTQAQTLRRTLIQRAGILHKPSGKLSLTLSANRCVAVTLQRYLRHLLNPSDYRNLMQR
jgi:DDE family transposase